MEKVQVTSSNLKSVAYEPAGPALFIEFKGITEADPTKTYRYAGVPAEHFQGICADKSPGKYFYAHIKGKYECTQIPTA
jgi:hypothetical protein